MSAPSACSPAALPEAGRAGLGVWMLEWALPPPASIWSVPRAVGRTWQGNSSSSFLLPHLCRFGDMSVGLRLSTAIKTGLQVSSKPAGSTPPCQVPPGQDSPLHSSTGYNRAASQAGTKRPTAPQEEALMFSGLQQPYQEAPQIAQGQQHKRQPGSWDGKTVLSPSSDMGRRQLRPHMSGDCPRDAYDFSWTPHSNCQLSSRLKAA